MPRKEKRVRVERGLYRAGDFYYLCATLPGSRSGCGRAMARSG